MAAIERQEAAELSAYTRAQALAARAAKANKSGFEKFLGSLSGGR